VKYDRYEKYDRQVEENGLITSCYIEFGPDLPGTNLKYADRGYKDTNNMDLTAFGW